MCGWRSLGRPAVTLGGGVNAHSFLSKVLKRGRDVRVAYERPEKRGEPQVYSLVDRS